MDVHRVCAKTAKIDFWAKELKTIDFRWMTLFRAPAALGFQVYIFNHSVPHVIRNSNTTGRPGRAREGEATKG